MQKTLIYDPSFSGHHSEYILHLIEFVKHSNKENRSFIFYIHQSLIENYGRQNNESILFIATEENQKLSLEVEFARLKNLILKFQCAEILFLMIDPYLERWKGVYHLCSLNITVKGILFRPYCRIHTNTFISRKTLRKWYKQILLQLVLLNSKKQTFFVLNDEKSVRQLSNLFFGKDTFEYLPDPVPIEKMNSRESVNITGRHKWNLLVIGSVDFRKNLYNILKGISLLDLEYQSVINLQIIGRVKSYYLKEFNELIESFKDDNVNVTLEIRNEFVSEEYFIQKFSESDIVLIPYIDFYSSSGVLGYAAIFHKPVIASDYGLINDLVKEFNLGKTISPKDPKEISKAITYFMDKKNQFKGNYKAYLDGKSPRMFSKILIS